MTSEQSPLTTVRASRRLRGAALAELRHDLAAFTSPADRLELAAILRQHPDRQTEVLRELVDLT